MKKLTLSLSLFCLLAATSCQKPKDWTCTCDVKPTGGSSKTVTADIKNKTQNDANTSCTNFGQNSVGGNGTWKCKVN